MTDREDYTSVGTIDAEDAPPRHDFVAAADLIAAPRPEAIVEGLVDAGGITVLVAESGAGKTFILLDVAAALSERVDHDGWWYDRGIVPGSVAYLSFEGDDLGRRLDALTREKHRSLAHVYILRASEPLSPLIDRDRVELPSRGEFALVAQLTGLREHLASWGLPPIRLVVVDTVRASLTGSEDSSEHVSGYLRACRRLLATVPGAGLILAHHAGWQDGDQKRKRERGSSAFRGNVDRTLYCEADALDTGGARLTLRTLKARDAVQAPPLRLFRRVVTLPGLDQWGRPPTSCVIEWDTSPATASADPGVTERADLDRLVLATLRDHPVTNLAQLTAYLNRRRADVSAALARVLAAGDAATGRRGERYTVTASGQRRLAESGHP